MDEDRDGHVSQFDNTASLRRPNVSGSHPERDEEHAA
jgi:hypothetical protein